MCTELSKLIDKKQAPDNAVAPHQIDMSSLFDLDVDDDIWQDIGLAEDDLQDVQPPPWMSDQSVRDGIKALLELDRCWEEEARLVHERRALQTWFSEEWGVITRALDAAQRTGTELIYHHLLNFNCIFKMIIACNTFFSSENHIC